VLRERGIALRRHGLTDEELREAVHYYTADHSLAWIGARFNVSPTTVAAALRRQGVQLRPRPGGG
jgi:hypothetical protein